MKWIEGDYLKRQAYENDEWINEKKAIKTFYEYTKKAYNTEITATPNYKKQLNIHENETDNNKIITHISDCLAFYGHMFSVTTAI